MLPGDQCITKDQVRRLSSVAGEPKTWWLVDGVGHAEIRNPVLDQLARDVIAFLDSALARPQAPVDALALNPGPSWCPIRFKDGRSLGYVYRPSDITSSEIRNSGSAIRSSALASPAWYSGSKNAFSKVSMSGK